jgi:hypothetical protein
MAVHVILSPLLTNITIFTMVVAYLLYAGCVQQCDQTDSLSKLKHFGCTAPSSETFWPLRVGMDNHLQRPR